MVLGVGKREQQRGRGVVGFEEGKTFVLQQGILIDHIPVL